MSERQDKKMTVSAIESGTVIDHIPSESTMKVVEILKLKDAEQIVSVAFNLASKSTKKKGIIKIGGKDLNKNEISRISLLAPNCTVNIIDDFKVKQKMKLDVPNDIIGVAKCINPNCVTNNEDVKTNFHVEERNPIRVRCIYCERTMTRDELIVQ